LVQAAKKLLADWQRAKEDWHDDNCQRFDQKYMLPLEATIRAAASALERVEAMLESAQQDCADTQGRAL
jgi:hypothetical protein